MASLIERHGDKVLGVLVVLRPGRHPGVAAGSQLCRRHELVLLGTPLRPPENPFLWAFGAPTAEGPSGQVLPRLVRISPLRD